MPELISPGVFVEGLPSGAWPIEPEETQVAALVGAFAEGPLAETVADGRDG